MGILSRLRKKLKVIGPGSESQPVRPALSPAWEDDGPEEEPQVSPRGDQDPLEYIDQVVKAHPVVLFMKGSPIQPQCGFSANAAGILSRTAPSLHHVDVLIDPDVPPGVLAGEIPVYVVVDDGMPEHSWVECRPDNNTAEGYPACEIPG